ncbi:unnamed protein product [Polarella glacialis]|uniref:Uncharacterized protein n=1 Tax=Polarella glacialis TaxID=89957 RepID=A0A813D2N8_POLGL|nr:unnamed protein product [Polarella glacialis]
MRHTFRSYGANRASLLGTDKTLPYFFTKQVLQCFVFPPETDWVIKPMGSKVYVTSPGLNWVVVLVLVVLLLLVLVLVIFVACLELQNTFRRRRCRCCGGRRLFLF